MEVCFCQTYKCNGARLTRVALHKPQKDDERAAQETRLRTAVKSLSPKPPVLQGLGKQIPHAHPITTFTPPTSSPSLPSILNATPPSIPPIYETLVKLDHKIHLHANSLTETPDAILTISWLQTESAWLHDTLQSLEMVNTGDDEASTVLHKAMVSQIDDAIQNLKTRQENLESKCTPAADAKVFQMGAATSTSHGHFN
jgi:hypothetical protein